MNPDRRKVTPMMLVCLYPLVSTFFMTLIWQITMFYYKPFLGGYYFKWVHLYTVDNSDWLRGDLKGQSQVLFSIYLLSYVALVTFALIAYFSRRLRPYMAWGMGLIWIADGYWIVWDMLRTEDVCWQYIFNLVEHLLFLAAVVIFSIYYLKLKKTDPHLFVVKKRKPWFRKKSYEKRF